MKKQFKKGLVSLFVLGCSATLLSACNKTPNFDGMSGSELLIALHEQMLKDHTTYIKYTDFQKYCVGTNKLYSIDRKSESDKSLVGFYTGKLQSGYSGFTREHVWACANSSGLWVHGNNKPVDPKYNVDNSAYKGGGSDLYHIRPCTSDINTKRGSAKLYVFPATAVKDSTYFEHSDGGPYIIKTDSNGEYANKFEPADENKGDMARILMYVYTHYSSIGDNSEVDEEVRGYLGALNLRDVFNSGYSLKEVQDIIVEWNELDPPDETEKLRNDTVEKIQGNRNPFVDHPEYIKKIFQEEE